MTPTDSGVGFWSEAAAGWVDDEERVEHIGGPLGLRTMDHLELRPGLRVLDVGCGTGSTAIELSRRTAPAGTVVGIDVSPKMLEAARAKMSRPPVEFVEFVEGDAQRTMLAAGFFDRVFSRFGVMFFDDPRAAFANLRRVLRLDGRLGLSPGRTCQATTGWASPQPRQALPSAPRCRSHSPANAARSPSLIHSGSVT